MIQAKIVADSINPQGNRIVSYLLTYPRIIHAELLTHRMFSRNAASSRAVPAKKLIASILENPFVPIAWQKEHPGMQGTEYITDPAEIEREIADWLDDRDYAVKKAEGRLARKVTKQLVNRPLEPFQWYTTLVTATEFENFFTLRCPQYVDSAGVAYRSRKDYHSAWGYVTDHLSDMDWRLKNKGMAEIHLMDLAEKMWDARNESAPVQLKAGDWHLPFGAQIKEMFNLNITDTDTDGIPYLVKISTMMAARTSYTVVGTDLSDWTIDKYLEKVNGMASAKPLHASPFEHCAKAMNDNEFHENVSGPRYYETDDEGDGSYEMPQSALGWSGNFRGFIQYRKMIPGENAV